MSREAIQLLRRHEHRLLRMKSELAELKPTTNDVRARRELLMTLKAAKEVRDQLETILLDTIAEDPIP